MKKSSVQMLTIVLLIVVLLGSWYTIFNNTNTENREYANHLSTAREKARLEIYDIAEENYAAALEMDDSIALRDEIAQFYYDMQKTRTYESFCEDIVELYPHEAVGYERLAQLYCDEGAYYSCYDMITTAQKRGIVSEKLAAMAEELAYKYEQTMIRFTDVGIFSGGYCAVMNDNGYWGFISESGKSTVRCSYNAVGNFTTAKLAAVQTTEGKYFLLDTANRIVSADPEEKEITDCGALTSGKMAVQYGGKYHYCDNDFHELFGAYDYAGAFNCGVAAVRNGSAWQIIDENGQPVSDKTFDEIKLDEKGVAFRNNLGFAKQGGKYILIDTKGQQIGNEVWDNVDVFRGNQPAAVMKGEQWGFIDTSGALVLSYKYTGARSFSNGFAAVEMYGKWGYIDSEAFEERISLVYDDARDFSSGGTAFVKIKDEWELIKIYRMNKDS